MNTQKKIRLSEDKFTSDMCSTKIVLTINEELKNNHFVDKKEKLFKKKKLELIGYQKIFKKKRKIRKVFFLTNKQKKKMIKFSIWFLVKKIKHDKIFFVMKSKQI